MKCLATRDYPTDLLTSDILASCFIKCYFLGMLTTQSLNNMSPQKKLKGEDAFCALNFKKKSLLLAPRTRKNISGTLV